MNKRAMLAVSDFDLSLGLTVILTAVVTVLIGYVLSKNFSTRLPPGPWGLPYLGYWPWLSHDWHLDFTKIGEKYGDIFTVYLFNNPLVILNGTKSMQEAFYKNPNAWAGRPYSHGFDLFELNPENLFKDDFTVKFKARRKFGMANLKKFGYGLPGFQENIEGLIDSTAAAFNSHKGMPFFFRDELWIYGAQALPSVLFGRRYKPNDKGFNQVLDDTEIWFAELRPVCEADVIPILRFFPRKCVAKSVPAVRRMLKWFTASIEERRAEFDPDNPCCFVDICILNKQDNDEILNFIMSFWGDGTDTIVGTIRWWIYFMAHYPEFQAKAQHEIEDAIGGRRPLQSDKKDLQFLEATFMETIRITTPVPTSLLLKTKEDVEILGYMIPKDTAYFANWDNMHKDPEVFENPDDFNPERFMLKDGTCDSKNKGWAGFAIGKRSCMGEPLARQVIFLFLANLLQQFTFSFPENEVPSKNFADLAMPGEGVVNMPVDFKIIATPRATS
ncbi:cytochrome P450 2B5-like isoform X2 [Lineus longissimus]|uniref:cytochrome P450 2B5-like isoform X2 n=1 Tax=Lineus longissimus TaxID=88925 RepID=UPI00315D8893